jgi:hypothetical protein
VLEPNGDMCVVRRDAITCVRLSSRTNESRVPNQNTGALQTI